VEGSTPTLHRRSLVGLLCLAIAVSACAARERQRPLQTSRIEQGAGTLEEARKALEGRWELMTLNVATADGRKAAIEATGLLTSDAFGRLAIEYRMSDAGQKTLEGMGIKSPNPVISTSGSVVIDPQQKRITYMAEDAQARALGFDPDLAARRANPFALERPRYYSFESDGTLTLATRHDNGADAAVSRWKKQS
jgi:hypothetical protein